MVQVCVGGLLRLGGDSGWRFVSKSEGDRFCAKGKLDVSS